MEWFGALMGMGLVVGDNIDGVGSVTSYSACQEAIHWMDAIVWFC